VELLKRTLKTDPHNTAVLKKLATIYRSRGNLRDALDAYSTLGMLYTCRAEWPGAVGRGGAD